MPRPPDRIPFIPPELVDWLDRCYPPRDATADARLEPLVFLGGQRDIIHRLRREMDAQTRKDIT